MSSILIIDDDDQLRQSFAKLLNEEGYSVDMAPSGEAGLEAVREKSFDLVVLEDDKNFFPVYNPAPVVHKETAEKYPELEDIFRKLGEKLDTEAMTNLNYQVDVERKSPRNAAKDWLKSVGFI